MVRIPVGGGTSDYTLAQPVQLWYDKYKKHVSESCLSRAIQLMGITRKKKTLGAVERDEEARRIFREVNQKLKADKVVVVNESGSRVYDQVIHNYGKNVTFLASMTLNGMQAAITIEGAVDGATFETFVRKVLLPTLRPNRHHGQFIQPQNADDRTIDIASWLPVYFLACLFPGFVAHRRSFFQTEGILAALPLPDDSRPYQGH